MPETEATQAEAGVRQGEGKPQEPPAPPASATGPATQEAAAAVDSGGAAQRMADAESGQAEAPAAGTEKQGSGGAGEAQMPSSDDAVPGEAGAPSQGGAEPQEQAEGRDKAEPQEQAEGTPEAPCCACEDPSTPGGKKRAELRAVSNARNANKGLRYWTCAQYAPRHWQKPAKKRKALGSADAAAPEPGCSFFRWLDQPVETREEREKAKKERLRKRELALLA